MKTFWTLWVGFMIGGWCNTPQAARIGLEAGTWTRVHLLGLPPITGPTGEVAK